MHLENYPSMLFFFFFFSQTTQTGSVPTHHGKCGTTTNMISISAVCAAGHRHTLCCVILIPNRLMRSHVGSNARQTPLRELKSHGWFGLNRGSRAKYDIQAYFATSESIKHEQHGLIRTNGTSENTNVVTRQQNGRQNLCAAEFRSGFRYLAVKIWKRNLF